MLGPAAVGQTIAVMDKSGKVVSTSKHLLNVFKEAKSAYRERKAEVVGQRQLEAEARRVRRALKAQTINDDHSTVRSSHSKPGTSRRHSGDSAEVKANSTYPRSSHRLEQDLHSRSPRSPTSPRSPHSELARRHTSISGTELMHRSHPPSPRRSSSTPAIDMDLAYGDVLPQFLHQDQLMVTRSDQEDELKGLVGKVKMLLEEADCLHYSVTAIIGNLQKNPDAMAAVALTLAEISNLVSKMAPGIVMSLKGSAPAVFALLASPQFLIAAGVGVGVTIIAFGGYKIIKKIKANNATAQDNGMDEMLEIGTDVSSIDTWRRGIAAAEAESVGTSVDGEFITPQAANLSRINLQEERTKESRHGGKSSKTSTMAKTEKSSGKDSKSSSRRGKEKKPEKEKKEKKPSPLRLMFK